MLGRLSEDVDEADVFTWDGADLWRGGDVDLIRADIIPKNAFYAITDKAAELEIIEDGQHRWGLTEVDRT